MHDSNLMNKEILISGAGEKSKLFQKNRIILPKILLQSF
jgi:hypothetical protein